MYSIFLIIDDLYNRQISERQIDVIEQEENNYLQNDNFYFKKF